MEEQNNYHQSWLISLWTLIVVLVSGVIVFDRMKVHDENFRNVDARLTAIEQCQHDNDTLHVRMLQQLNEVSYELKLTQKEWMQSRKHN